MHLGVQYVGLVHNSTHMQWLINSVDRASLKFICESGSFLYQEELGATIQDLFGDLVDDGDVNDDAIKADSDDEEGDEE